jgi:hypothetical protein
VRLAAAAAAAAACDLPARPSVPPPARLVERPAVLVSGPDTAWVEAPPVVVVDTPYTLAVVTLAGGCVTPGPTRVVRRGLTVDVTPRDREPAPGQDVACPAVRRYAPHRVDVVFRDTGVARIRVHGRADGRGGAAGRDTVLVRLLPVHAWSPRVPPVRPWQSP